MKNSQESTTPVTTVSVDDIIDYETGEMSNERCIKMFQALIDSGQAWTLQGHYGRTARTLIDEGYCTKAK